MNNKQDQSKREATPVMKQLARPMSKEELAVVAGAGCAPGANTSHPNDPKDYEF